MEEKLLDLIEKYTNSLEKQKNLWNLMNKTFEGQKEFVLNSWKQLSEETKKIRQEIQNLIF